MSEKFRGNHLRWDASLIKSEVSIMNLYKKLQSVENSFWEFSEHFQNNHFSAHTCTHRTTIRTYVSIIVQRCT